jgi:hypothetical protein
MKPYVIKQGDYLKKLAHMLSFDADKVWNDSKNSDLKEKRKDPAILLPGDILYVPDEPKKRCKFKKESENKYQAKIPKVEVKVQLSDDGEPLKDEPYIVEGIGNQEEQKTDGDGFITVIASVHAREVQVVLPERHTSFNVRIGGIDPMDTPSGLRMRLANLGYYGSTVAGSEPHQTSSEEQIKSALISFQLDQGLKATGEMDDDTKQALKKSHGS